MPPILARVPYSAGALTTAKTWAGLDVGAETTSLWVIHDAGEILQEARCPTDLTWIHRESRGLKD